MVDLRHTYNGKYRRLRLDAPAPTVDTHFASASNFLHPTEHRGLSLREAMRHFKASRTGLPLGARSVRASGWLATRYHRLWPAWLAHSCATRF